MNKPGALVAGMTTLAGVFVGSVAWLWPDPAPKASGSERLSYIAAVDRLCTSAQQHLRDLGPAPKSNPYRYANWLHSTSTVLNDEVLVPWGRLEPPAGDTPKTRAALDSLEHYLSTSDEAANLYTSGDPTRAGQKKADANTLSEQYREQSRGYGLSICPDLLAQG